MPDERRLAIVVDASVAAKVWFQEVNSQLAREVQEQAQLFAPDFLTIEISSVGAKRVRRGWTADAVAIRAIREVALLIDEFTPSGLLAPRAYELARDHGFSVYDGLYLALAEEKEAPVVTADTALISKARSAGLGHLVQPLSESDPPR